MLEWTLHEELTLILSGSCRTLSEHIRPSTTSRAVPRSCITVTQAISAFRSGDLPCRDEVVTSCFGLRFAIQLREACACRCQQCDLRPVRPAGC